MNAFITETQGPCTRRYELVGNTRRLVEECYRSNERLHRLDGPALRKWEYIGDSSNIAMLREHWYIDSYRYPCRTDNQGPSVGKWIFDRNGTRYKFEERWTTVINGELETHRIDGPAVRMWEVNIGGGLHRKLRDVWIMNGMRHRIDGPALSAWGPQTNSYDHLWTVYGRDYDVEYIKRRVSVIIRFLRCSVGRFKIELYKHA